MRLLPLIVAAATATQRIVINTWPFVDANKAAWKVLASGGSALDAITAGTSKCEALQCDGSVGWGSHPDATGEVTLDAMIMDGQTANVGAVGALRHVRDAAKVARHVLDNTAHTLLVGSMASDFANEMGFMNQTLESDKTREEHAKWISSKCQPNYYMNVTPDPKSSCGPFSPISNENDVQIHRRRHLLVSEKNHDTIGMIAFDVNGRTAAGTTTNGMINKIPGRVGDSPIAGAGSYINEHGGAAATGDGDVMMRFLPTYQTVESMRLGMTPRQAALDALNRIVSKYDGFVGAIIAINARGEYGAACHNINDFPYVISSDATGGSSETLYQTCSKTHDELKQLMRVAFHRSKFH